MTNVRNEIEQAQQLLAKDERTYHDKEVRSLDYTMQASQQKETTLKETLATFSKEAVWHQWRGDEVQGASSANSSLMKKTTSST